MNPHDAQAPWRSNPVAQFFLVPFEIRTYTNLLYLALAFPLGLAYFIFLIVGLSVGFGLTIVWIGLPILGLVFAGSWGLAALERQMAIGLLGAEIPPMSPPEGLQGKGFWGGIQAFLSNPVTWKGMAYLLLKFPMGIFSFTMGVILLSVSLAFMLVPFAFLFGYDWLYMDGSLWWVDTLGEALACGLFGSLIALLSLHAFNGLAAAWRLLATGMLGSRRFAAPPPAPILPEPAPAV